MQVRGLRNRIRQWGGELVCDTVSQRYIRRVGRTSPPNFLPQHLQIAGFYRRRNGISEGAELQRRALAVLGLVSSSVDATAALRNPFARSAQQVRSAAVVAHASGRQIGAALTYMAPSSHDALRVGYCAWELGGPPKTWGRFDAALHEVWTPSLFSAEALRQTCTAPVRVVRHVCQPPLLPPPGGMRKALGLRPDGFVGLVMADTRSSFARKNPLGAIKAFSQAFAKDKDATLIVKVAQPDRETGMVEQLRHAAGEVRAIFLEDYLEEIDKWRLFQDASVFLSLHRAEGYSLPLLEAMTLGTPVVATNWSGNLDYMDADNAVLTPYRLVDVRDRQGVYSGGEWAEPDIDFATDALRKLRSDPDFADQVGRAARARASVSRQLEDFADQLPPWTRQLRSPNPR